VLVVVLAALAFVLVRWLARRSGGSGFDEARARWGAWRRLRDEPDDELDDTAVAAGGEDATPYVRSYVDWLEEK
jgi:hypothetical protein